MAKKSGRKSGGAAGIETVEDSENLNPALEDSDHSPPAAKSPPAQAKGKAKDDQSASGNFGIGEIKKAAAFANSVGGLDKAIALLQILKVAKEVI